MFKAIAERWQKIDSAASAAGWAWWVFQAATGLTAGAVVGYLASQLQSFFALCGWAGVIVAGIGTWALFGFALNQWSAWGRARLVEGARTPSASSASAPTPIARSTNARDTIDLARSFRPVDMALDLRHLTRPVPYLSLICTCFNGSGAQVQMMEAAGRIKFQAEEFHAPLELRIDDDTPAPNAGLSVCPYEFATFILKVRLDADSSVYARNTLGNGQVLVTLVDASIAAQSSEGSIFSVSFPRKIKFDEASGRSDPPFIAQFRQQGA